LNVHAVEFTANRVYVSREHEMRDLTMPRAALDDSDRMNLRVKPEVKARLMRAAALRHTDLTNFVTQSALREADAVIAEAEVIRASDRDFERIVELLDNPPRPNGKLRAAAAVLPKAL
jgi:uncharacterized protein (DUF1778 family)